MCKYIFTYTLNINVYVEQDVKINITHWKKLKPITQLKVS